MRIAHMGGATCTGYIVEEQRKMGHDAVQFQPSLRKYSYGDYKVFRLPKGLRWFELRDFDVLHLNAFRLLPQALETLIPGKQKIVLHHHGADVLGTGEPLGAKWAHHTFCNYDLAAWCPDSEPIPLPVNFDEKSTTDSGYAHWLETAPEKAGGLHVRQACNELQIPLHFHIPRLSHSESLKMMASARVVIGKVSRWHGMPGMTINEAMAMGKPTMCWVSDRVKKLMPPGLPVVSVTPETLRIELDRLWRSRSLREELGGRGIEYVRKHHRPYDIAKRMVEVYEKA